MPIAKKKCAVIFSEPLRLLPGVQVGGVPRCSKNLVGWPFHVMFDLSNAELSPKRHCLSGTKIPGVGGGGGILANATLSPPD